MKKNSKLTKGLCMAMAAVMLIGCSFAYFTDYATTQANGTAGTVAVSLDSNINLLDANGRDIINPGDMRDAGFTVTNEGNKSIDVRTTIALTTQSNTGFDLSFSGSASEQSEYDLYLRSDVDFVEGYGYQPKADAQPLQVKSIDQDVITYVLPEYILNGNDDKYDEVETVDGVDAYSAFNDYVFVMKGAAGNEWQNSSVSIDVIVEAKQHENTAAGWDIVAQENITVGSIDKSAVKGETVITEILGTNTPDEEKTTYIPVISKDEEGNDLNATSTLIEGEKADELLDALEEAGLAQKEDVDLLIDVESDDFDGMADTTFDVSEIAEDGDTAVIMHYDETKGEWEYIATETVVDGKVNGDFSSYSPVAIQIIKKEETSSDLYLVGMQLVADMGEDADMYPMSPVYSQMQADGLNLSNLNDGRVNQLNSAAHGYLTYECDIELAGANDSGCFNDSVREKYNWTNYELISETETTVTVKLICDAADFSGVKLEDLPCGCYDDSYNVDGVAIEGTNLTWTHTFDKKAASETPELTPDEAHTFQYWGLASKNYEKIVFTNEPVPDGVATEDASVPDVGAVVAYSVNQTLYITTTDGGTIYAPADCAELFTYLHSSPEIHFHNFDVSAVTNANGMFDSLVNTIYADDWKAINPVFTDAVFQNEDSNINVTVKPLSECSGHDTEPCAHEGANIMGDTKTTHRVYCWDCSYDAVEDCTFDQEVGGSCTVCGQSNPLVAEPYASFEPYTPLWGSLKWNGLGLDSRFLSDYTLTADDVVQMYSDAGVNLEEQGYKFVGFTKNIGGEISETITVYDQDKILIILEKV